MLDAFRYHAHRLQIVNLFPTKILSLRLAFLSREHNRFDS